MNDSEEIYDDVEVSEVRLLLDVVYAKYGYDFRDYAYPSVKRRILNSVATEGVASISGLLDKIQNDPACMARLLLHFTVHASSMFRHPSFYKCFREKVVPQLKTYPFVRIWHAGCSTGEEVYSMAILLHEEGIYKRSIIYATDISEDVIQKAKSGIFPMNMMKEFTSNYLKSGGIESFSDYYTAQYDNALFSSHLKENIVFAKHNLVTDASPNEFNVILCRNVMIYFKRELQNKTHELFFNSLIHFGYLGLGEKETLRFTPRENNYEEVDVSQKLYRRTA
ncbi:MAG: protein-glutamate O-methyltransferase CheR [Deltaproteobacteria bacterium]|nr:protein-glutamate O-methyltransferase CheR [Deltaproteobacteria bacterium]